MARGRAGPTTAVRIRESIDEVDLEASPRGRAGDDNPNASIAEKMGRLEGTPRLER
ncbi:hypothetical protein RBH26_07765 [Natronolimnohabitans sp. A-GB9]|uniref:hypothetical protein n=1 Tax=Natronolimnohabitans sp. A-GB9 TaxID=3069757 RepID=UPI0027B00FE9|nr:hypothetical protein [Natronolimnohabitans sp. A-GB9]MDQ2050381.1 hypothetical protein [Natronolimnohabitans sp. A-GB9]